MGKFVIIEGVKHHVNHIPKKKLKKPEKPITPPKKYRSEESPK